MYIATDHCPQDIDADYEIMWPPTIVNMDASNNCPGGDGMDRYSDLRMNNAETIITCPKNLKPNKVAILSVLASLSYK